MVVTFQAASPQRFDDFWVLEQACHPLPWSESNLYSCLMGNYWGELMRVDGKPAGFYLFQQVLDELTLVNICVSPALQGKGLGQQLLQRGITQAEQRDAAVCFLEVRAGNSAAIALYNKSGFNQDSVRKGYYPAIAKGDREDALLMSYSFS
ncbi:ribosomal protein S18-alanine N-acetyltransferase [Ferrimonas lipolytica]|uniref:[Ribosomal protein bS18]-alanine N-acetyltransferase n=1 Tax=Ferrimonas lipolytica TaxID=2724191 RepID=A0A6H1UES5_9GAMM|nr:ribosomal protein S18-alanine N-acetyltransferase [Ferrimonas lipolytica]QIZ77595.1 ribosomal protein S18-alanine N-acetyltransferase [Ferrimonas lipolytica]